MKKSIFINISIVNHLWFLYICLRLFQGYSSNSLIILLIIMTIYLRRIFIDREYRIEKKSKLILFILCSINYTAFVVLIIALSLGLEKIIYWITFFGLVLYITTISMYISMLFGVKDSQSAEK